MKWRTDKPTAKLIIAYLEGFEFPWVLMLNENGQYIDDFYSEVCTDSIEKWADLEEDETVTDCNQLEEEIQTQLEVQLCGGYGGWNDGLTDEQLKDFARYFAKWGAENLKK